MAEAAEQEVEVHGGEHEHHVHHDGTRFGKFVGLGVALTGVVLAVVSISSHRAHTAAIIYRTETNDIWAEYQAKHERQYIAGAVIKLAPLLSGSDASRQELADAYKKDSDRYSGEMKQLKSQAEGNEKSSENEESRALLLDTSEGFFELGLVLSSLFFLSRRKMFPWLGAVAAIVGAVFGTMGFMA
jgi:hypothetical protein